MSHFSVLVIGADPEAQLAPYHEFECTGNDEYVQDIDITKKAWDEYQANTTAQIVGPDGLIYSCYDDRFYRDLTEEERKEIGPIGGMGSCKFGWFTSRDWGDGKGYQTKMHYVPEGFTEQEVPTSTVQTFAQFIESYYDYSCASLDNLDLEEEHKYGYYLVQNDAVTVIDRTNPNAKWDWYQLGGRWDGLLISTSGESVNQAIKSDVDFDAMYAIESQRAGELWDQVHAVVAGRQIPNWKEIQERHKNIDDARKEWHDHPVNTDMHLANMWVSNIEHFDCPRETYCHNQAMQCMRCFAVIKDGIWYEKGEMGWWGITTNEKDQTKWNEEFDALLKGLPDDTLLSVYDCHI